MDAELGEPAVGLRALDATRSSLTARSSPSPGRGARQIFRIEPATAARRGRRAFTELDGRGRRGDGRRVAGAPPRRVARRARPGDGPWRACCAGACRSRRPALHRRARADRLRHDRRRTAHALSRAGERGVPGPDGELPPLVVHVARRPDRERRERPGPGDPVPHQPRHRRGRRRLRREHRLRPRVPRARSTGEWGVVDVDDCVAAARFLVERGDVDPSASRSEAAAPAATRRSPRSRSATCSRPASASSASATSSCPPTRTSSSRATTSRLVGPYPEAADALPRALAGPPPRPDSRPGAGPPGPRRQGRAAVPGRGDRGGPPARHPVRLSRVRGRGPRLPRRVRDPARRWRRELSFLGPVFGFEPADGFEPLEIPGLEAWPRAAGRPRERAGA